jgi:hypothetical protein
VLRRRKVADFKGLSLPKFKVAVGPPGPPFDRRSKKNYQFPIPPPSGRRSIQGDCRNR